MSVVTLRNRMTGLEHAVDDQAVTGANTEDVDGNVTGPKRLLDYLLEQRVTNTATGQMEPKFEVVADGR